MNKDRRKAIAAVAAQVRDLQVKLSDLLDSGLEGIESSIEELRDEEQEYYDNMPESLQGGEKGDAAQQAVEYLDAALELITELQDMASKLEEAADQLDNAETV